MVEKPDNGSHQTSTGMRGSCVRQAHLPPLDPLIDVSVVIVNWNTRELLRGCLSSLLDHVDSLQIETIVVDNGSGDGSAAMVAREFPWVCLLTNTRNLGFAAANNQGMSRAHGGYLLLLNSDTVVLPGALQRMIHFMDEHPHVGALGPRLLNADGSLQSSARDFSRPGRDALAILEVERWPLVGTIARRNMRRRSAYWSDHQPTREVDWAMGACLLLRRDALEQVGLLDDAYFFFAEEMDLCYRLRQQGWPVVFLADAEIVHLGGQSASRVPAARLVWHYTGLLRFYHLHRPRLQQIVIRAVIALAATAHIVWLLAAHRGSPDGRVILASYARVLARALR